MISVGLDVSKGKSMVCMLKPYGEIIEKPYEISHTESEISKFIKHYDNWMERSKLLWKQQAFTIFHCCLN